MKNFRVCMLTTGFPRFQGDLFGTFVQELAQELTRGGEMAVEVLAPHAVGLPTSERFGAVEVRRFRYFWPAARQAVAYGGGIPSNIRASWIARLQVPFFLLGFFLRAFTRVRKGQVVHCHWTITGLVAYCATRIWRRPLVLSVRGSDINMLEKGMLARLHQLIYGWMDVVVAVSEDIAEKLALVGVPKGKIKVVTNGVDRRFHPGDRAEARRELALPAEGIIVLFVGLIVPVKGLEILVDALARFSGDGEKPLCLLVGEGPQKAELQRAAEEKGLNEYWRFVGQRATDEIPVWMVAADMLVLPSYSEGRPNVVLEAQACALPVVATRVGGTPELVQDGINGLLVDSGDAQALAEAIQRLSADEVLRQALGQAGREQAGAMTWTASAQKMAAIYRDLLEAE
jgi:teichuronic acid biosynthesis glycosyltransferase TuaC